MLILLCSWLFIATALGKSTAPIQKINYTPEISIQKTKFTVTKQSQKNNTLTLWVEDALSTLPFREKTILALYDSIYKQLPSEYQSVKLNIISNNRTLEELVPNFYRTTIPIDTDRRFATSEITSIVQNTSKPYSIQSGLQNKHIALWNSHGWYYNVNIDKWEWQRGRLFGTVEDMLTTSFVLPYLLPMLENAGAAVFIPRERDTQTNEVIIDNDVANAKTMLVSTNWENQSDGFKPIKQLKGKDNPFESGTYLRTNCYTTLTDSVVWIFTVPEDGWYYVSIAYKTLRNSNDKALYHVQHAGGKTAFTINQTMGGGTWIYLGKFYFKKDNEYPTVLYNQGEKGTVVTADAIRLGGGIGNNDRTDNTQGIVRSKENPPFIPEEMSSTPTLPLGRARFTEAARYYLQFSGVPDSLISNQRKDVISDYQDDMFGRANWANYLMGGSVMHPSYKGLGIPIDACIALHTDAGILGGDSIVGTLGIAMTTDDKGKYPAKYDRIAARDMTDIIQSEIVNDIQQTFSVEWNRRAIWDKSYVEARIPKTPTTIIELLSHQNFNDMRFAHSPEFRFLAARSMYKGIVKFLASQNNQPFTIQPLAITHLAAELKDKDSVRISWKKVLDSLEPTAIPNAYIVYTRINDGGFDNGIVSQKESITLPIEKGLIYSFKVGAINDGGESMPSEIVSVHKAEKEKGRAWIINGFDRVDAPRSFSTDSTAGFMYESDGGVPYLYDLGFTGNQIEFNKSAPFYDNDYPGFGASQANYEGQVIAGNTFDNIYLHGRAMAALGYSFSSGSRNGTVAVSPNWANYEVLNILFGKQKTSTTHTHSYTIYPADLQQLLINYTKTNGKIIITGAYVGSDITQKKDKTEMLFAQNTLKYKLRVPQASVNTKTVDVFSSKKRQQEFVCHTQPNPTQYAVQQVDAIQPTDKNSSVLLRYTENNTAAAIGYKGKYKTIISGFPFEALTTATQQLELMRLFLNY